MRFYVRACTHRSIFRGPIPALARHCDDDSEVRVAMPVSCARSSRLDWSNRDAAANRDGAHLPTRERARPAACVPAVAGYNGKKIGSRPSRGARDRNDDAAAVVLQRLLLPYVALTLITRLTGSTELHTLFENLNLLTLE